MYCGRCGREVYVGRSFCPECARTIIGAPERADLPFFVNELSSKDEGRRAAARDIVVDFGESAFEPLMNMLATGGYYSRTTAVEILNRIGNSNLVLPLINLLENTEQSKVQKRIIEILGNLRDKRSLRIIYKYSNNKNEYVQKSAKDALSKYKRFFQTYTGETIPIGIKDSPRHVDDDAPVMAVGGRFVGLRVAQIVYTPSFSQGFAWEIRRTRHDFRLYKSYVVNPMKDWIADYLWLDFPSDKLEDYFHKLRDISQSISPLYSATTGLDGTLYHLALYGDQYSAVRFVWWSQPPPQWKAMVELVSKMIAEFLDAKELEDTSL